MSTSVNELPALIINAFAEQIAQAALQKLNDRLHATIAENVEKAVEAAIQKHLSVPKEYIQDIARQEIQANFEGPGFKETIETCFESCCDKRVFSEAVEAVIDEYDLSNAIEDTVSNMNFTVSVSKY